MKILLINLKKIKNNYEKKYSHNRQKLIFEY